MHYEISSNQEEEMIMSKLAAMALAMFFMVGGTAAYAKSATMSEQGMFEVDGSLAVANGPGSFDGGPGVNFGAGYLLSTIDKNLQARVDLSYYNFSSTFGVLDLSYSRIPVTVSARYYFPINDRMKAFAQAGIETSFDSKESPLGPFFKQSKNEVNFGLAPGGGIEFFVLPEVSLFALGRIHIISDSYFSMQFGAALHF
jgi:opacity protein-like surface antigen